MRKITIEINYKPVQAHFTRFIPIREKEKPSALKAPIAPEVVDPGAKGLILE